MLITGEPPASQTYAPPDNLYVDFYHTASAISITQARRYITVTWPLHLDVDFYHTASAINITQARRRRPAYTAVT